MKSAGREVRVDWATSNNKYALPLTLFIRRIDTWSRISRDVCDEKWGKRGKRTVEGLVSQKPTYIVYTRYHFRTVFNVREITYYRTILQLRKTNE